MLFLFYGIEKNKNLFPEEISAPFKQKKSCFFPDGNPYFMTTISINFRNKFKEYP